MATGPRPSDSLTTSVKEGGSTPATSKVGKLGANWTTQKLGQPQTNVVVQTVVGYLVIAHAVVLLKPLLNRLPGSTRISLCINQFSEGGVPACGSLANQRTGQQVIVSQVVYRLTEVVIERVGCVAGVTKVTKPVNLLGAPRQVIGQIATSHPGHIVCNASRPRCERCLAGCTRTKRHKVQRIGACIKGELCYGSAPPTKCILARSDAVSIHRLPSLRTGE